MRAHWVGTAVVVILLTGCSEKQKEAARLEAAMKTGDSVVQSTEEYGAGDSVRGRLDSALAEISVQVTGGSGDGATDSQSVPPVDDTVAGIPVAEATISNPETTTHALTSAVDTSEPVLDAGAIPVEELVKSTPKRQVKSEAVATPAPSQDQSGAMSTSQSQQSTLLQSVAYVVQVTSTPDQDEAKALVTKFTRNGYRAFMTQAVVDGTTYFRVRIGRYASIAEADAALVELHEKFKVNGFVAQVK